MSSRRAAQSGVTTAEYVVLGAVLVLGLVAGVSLFRRSVDAAAAAEGQAVREVASGRIGPIRDRYGEALGVSNSAVEAERAAAAEPELQVAFAPAPAAKGPPGGPTGRGGRETRDVMPEDDLRPLRAKLEGPALFINDNPETFRRPGVLGSTMGPVPGRGDTTHDFRGRGRFFALAQNGTGKALRQQLLVLNTSRSAQTYTVRGTVFANKGGTKTDGRIPEGYRRDGIFQGPQAIAATSFLDAQPGRNGYVERKVTVAPGEVAVLNTQYHERGAEIFALVEVSAQDPQSTFRLANVATEGGLDARGRADLAAGRLPAAGDPTSGKDYADAEGAKMGRPNGVVTGGSIVRGGREITLAPGLRDGDLVMSTDTRNSGGQKGEIARIDKTLPNPPGLGPAATQNDGNYGLEYRLDYTLKNPTGERRQVEIFMTSPPQRAGDVLRPDGGAMTMPVEVDGRRVEVRVNERGTGISLGTVSVEPGESRPVRLRWAHLGNTFPPAGLEFRVR